MNKAQLCSTHFEGFKFKALTLKIKYSATCLALAQAVPNYDWKPVFVALKVGPILLSKFLSRRYFNQDYVTVSIVNLTSLKTYLCGVSTSNEPDEPIR